MDVQKIWDLPPIPFQRIIKKMKPEMVIELTMKYKAFNRRLQMFKLAAQSFEWRINETPDSAIEIGFGATKVIFGFEEDYQKLKCDSTLEINGKSMKAEIEYRSEWDKVFIYFKPCVGSLQLLEDITEHFSKLLNFKNFRCSINDDTELIKLFVWRFTRCFFGFILERPHRNATAEEMKFLLENVKSTNLQLPNKMEDLKYNGQINAINVDLGNSDWVDADNIFGFGCANILSIKLTAEKLNKILQKWFTLENDSLESIHGNIEGLAEGVLEGIESTASVFTTDDFRLRSRGFPDNFVDIKRNTDGRRATLFATPCFNQILFWHDKHYKYCSRETKQRLGLIRN